MLFVCYPKCTTCLKAKKYLDDRGLSYTLRDIKLENPTREELALWHEQSGLELRKFFNTSGLQYRALGLRRCARRRCWICLLPTACSSNVRFW